MGHLAHQPSFQSPFGQAVMVAVWQLFHRVAYACPRELRYLYPITMGSQDFFWTIFL